MARITTIQRAAMAGRRRNGKRWCEKRSRKIATTCDTIFPLPRAEAGMRCPHPAATFRRPVTAISRPRMIITIQAGTASISTRDRKAAAVSSLSAMGSRRMPSRVTWLRRRAK